MGAITPAGGAIIIKCFVLGGFCAPRCDDPMGAEQNQMFRPYCTGAWVLHTHMHPGAITPIGAILNTTTAAYWPPATTRSVVNERRSKRTPSDRQTLCRRIRDFDSAKYGTGNSISNSCRVYRTPGCENTIKYFFLVFFFAPRCHNPDGCQNPEGCDDPHNYGSCVRDSSNEVNTFFFLSLQSRGLGR